jgi:hypothetical protein
VRSVETKKRLVEGKIIADFPDSWLVNRLDGAIERLSKQFYIVVDIDEIGN